MAKNPLHPEGLRSSVSSCVGKTVCSPGMFDLRADSREALSEDSCYRHAAYHRRFDVYVGCHFEDLLAFLSTVAKTYLVKESTALRSDGWISASTSLLV